MDSIIDKIKYNYDSFSKKHKKLADYLLEESDKAILMPISELADDCGVSEATIVRFTYKLGYSGYKEFQRALLDSIKYSLTTLQRLDIYNNFDGYELIQSQINGEINDINTTYSNLDLSTLEKAAIEIDKSKKIYILGLRTSNIIAQYFAHYLKMLGFQVILIEGTLMEPFEQLVTMTSDDILISFSFPRYSQRTINSSELIYKKGYRIISITDSIHSPICKFSTISLVAMSNMNYFFDSMVATMVLVNSLLLTISNITKRDFKKLLSELEEFWERDQTYEKI